MIEISKSRKFLKSFQNCANQTGLTRLTRLTGLTGLNGLTGTETKLFKTETMNDWITGPIPRDANASQKWNLFVHTNEEFLTAKLTRECHQKVGPESVQSTGSGCMQISWCGKQLPAATRRTRKSPGYHDTTLSTVNGFYCDQGVTRNNA